MPLAGFSQLLGTTLHGWVETVFEFRLGGTQQPILTMLVLPERAPEANHPSCATSLRNNDAKRVELTVTSEGAKQRHLWSALALPILPVRPVQHHCTITPARQPFLFNIVLPIWAIRVHEE